MFGDNDLDSLSGGQLCIERHQGAVNLGAAAAMAEVGVYAVGEVYRCRTARQVDHPSLRRQHVNRLVEGGLFVVPDPVRSVGGVVSPAQQLAQPGDFLVVAVLGGRLAAFFVAPVGGDAKLGVVVHFARPDLNFNRPAVGTMHGRVQRAIVVAFWMRDVVVELPGDR